MKFPAAMVALLASSALLVAEEEWGDASPVVAVTPPAAMVAGVAPVLVDLLRVLEAPRPDPVLLAATLARMEPGEIARVLVDFVGDPAKLDALVAVMPPGAAARVAGELVRNPPALAALVTRLAPGQVAQVVVAAVGSPERLAAVMAALPPERAAEVALELASTPEVLAAAMAALSTERLQRVTVELFLADVEGWEAVAGFMAEPLPKRRQWRGSVGWLEASRDALRRKIRRAGYTPELLAEAVELMQKAAAPPKRRKAK